MHRVRVIMRPMALHCLIRVFVAYSWSAQLNLNETVVGLSLDSGASIIIHSWRSWRLGGSIRPYCPHVAGRTAAGMAVLGAALMLAL